MLHGKLHPWFVVKIDSRIEMFVSAYIQISELLSRWYILFRKMA